jgi:hypothetical protein
VSKALLDPSTRVRAKIGLFGSEDAGERVAAAQAGAFVHRLGLTCHDVILRWPRLPCPGDRPCSRREQSRQSTLPGQLLIELVRGEAVVFNIGEFGSRVMSKIGRRLLSEEDFHQPAKRQSKTRRGRNGKES